jgi:hypothetical protein
MAILRKTSRDSLHPPVLTTLDATLRNAHALRLGPAPLAASQGMIDASPCDGQTASRPLGQPIDARATPRTVVPIAT